MPQACLAAPALTGGADEAYLRGMAADGTPVPAAMKVAILLWRIAGCLQILYTLALLAPSLLGGSPGGKLFLAALLPLVLGLVFLNTARQYAKAKETDTLGNGIISLVLGLGYLAVTLAHGLAGLLVALGLGSGALILVMLVGLVASSVLGLCLAAAGVLALSARAAYREWLVRQLGAGTSCTHT